jgi:hypothetical protein
VYGFSDPPRDQCRLVLGPHLCCRTSTVVLVRCFHLFWKQYFYLVHMLL